jgi:hypothetical protein
MLLLSGWRPWWALALSGVLMLLTFSVSEHPATTETPLTFIRMRETGTLAWRNIGYR